MLVFDRFLRPPSRAIGLETTLKASRWGEGSDSHRCESCVEKLGSGQETGRTWKLQLTADTEENSGEPQLFPEASKVKQEQPGIGLEGVFDRRRFLREHVGRAVWNTSYDAVVARDLQVAASDGTN